MAMSQEELKMVIDAIKEKMILLYQLEWKHKGCKTKAACTRKANILKKTIYSMVDELNRNSNNFYKPKNISITTIYYHQHIFNDKIEDVCFWVHGKYESLDEICNTWIYFENENDPELELLYEINGKSRIGKYIIINFKDDSEPFSSAQYAVLREIKSDDPIDEEFDYDPILNYKIYNTKKEATIEYNKFTEFITKKYKHLKTCVYLYSKKTGNMLDDYLNLK